MASPSGDHRELRPATGLPDHRLVGPGVLGNFLHLVITCLRRNNRSKKMLLTSHEPVSNTFAKMFVPDLVNCREKSSAVVCRRADCSVLEFVARESDPLSQSRDF